MAATTVITHPIALCSYVLSLVFGLLAKRLTARNQRASDQNLLRLSACLAVIALVGGLFLAWSQTKPERVQPSASTGPSQVSYGGQDPNVSGAKDVTITYGSGPPAAVGGNEKKPERVQPSASTGPSQVSYGAQGPNVSGAKDVTITYGSASPAAVGGKAKKQ